MISHQNIHRLGGHKWLSNPRCKLCRETPTVSPDLYGNEKKRAAERTERTRIARADLVTRGVLRG